MTSRSRNRILILLAVLTLVSGGAALLEHGQKLSKESLDYFALAVRQIASLFNLVLLIVHGGIFMGVGLAPLRWVLLRRELPALFLLPLCLIFSSLTGYLVFWAYFLYASFGFTVSLFVLALAIREIVLWYQAYQNRDTWIQGVRSDSVGWPLGLMFGLAATYHCLLCSFQLNPPDYVYTATLRYIDALPSDNLIPLIFANRLWEGGDPRIIFTEWLSSDRPPLQTGIVLVQRPLELLSGNNFDRPYQILSTFVQCQWVAAVWLLCRSACLSIRTTRRVILLCATTGFFLLNSTFVWPKLLAGSLIVFAFVFILPALAEKKPLSVVRALSSSTSAMLAFLSHGGAAFSILALLILGLPLLRYWRAVLPASALALLLYAPWALYQRYYNPPGDRLLKWHLAGVPDVSDPRPFSVALRQQYAQLSISEWTRGKSRSLWECVRPPEEASLQSFRNRQFFGLLPALGVLNLGWFIALYVLLKQRYVRAGIRLRYMALFVGLSHFIWILLMYEPGSTVNHQNSYATLIVIFALCSVACLRLPHRAQFAILCAHLLVFASVWLLTTPEWGWRLKLARLNLPMLVCGATLLVLLVRTWKSRCTFALLK